MITRELKHEFSFHFIFEMRFPAFIITAAVVLGMPLHLVSCAASLPDPTTTEAERAAELWPGATLNDLVSGRGRYIEKCSGCHSLSSPKRYSDREWDTIVTRMKMRAKLSPNEEALILEYLVSGASNHEKGKSE